MMQTWSLCGQSKWVTAILEGKGDYACKTKVRLMPLNVRSLQKKQFLDQAARL